MDWKIIVNEYFGQIILGGSLFVIIIFTRHGFIGENKFISSSFLRLKDRGITHENASEILGVIRLFGISPDIKNNKRGTITGEDCRSYK